jgi:SET domain
VQKSLIPSAGKGLFAARNFEAGEIVTISPTMVVSKQQVERMSRETDSIFQNYCIASPDVSSIVLFPFGLSGIANHARAEKANMEMEWYWWSEDERENKMNASAEDLSRAAFAQLDIAFRAKVDILEGTELTYDYGEDWADDWVNYLGQLNQWHINEAWIGYADSNHEPLSSKVKNLVLPEFRSFIAAPENFFFPHWHDQPGSTSTHEGHSEFESESESEYLVQDHMNQTTGHVDIIQEIDIDPLGTVNSAPSGTP